MLPSPPRSPNRGRRASARLLPATLFAILAIALISLLTYNSGLLHRSIYTAIRVRIASTGKQWGDTALSSELDNSSAAGLWGTAFQNETGIALESGKGQSREPGIADSTGTSAEQLATLSGEGLTGQRQRASNAVESAAAAKPAAHEGAEARGVPLPENISTTATSAAADMPGPTPHGSTTAATLPASTAATALSQSPTAETAKQEVPPGIDAAPPRRRRRRSSSGGIDPDALTQLQNLVTSTERSMPMGEYTSASKAFAGLVAASGDPGYKCLARRMEGGGGSRMGAAVGADLAGADSCTAALCMPKIALMFLTKGDLPLEPVWNAWLRQAVGMVSAPHAQEAVCGGGGNGSLPQAAAARKVQELCGGDASTLSGHEVAAAQQLFTLYVHSSPEHQGYDADSVFHKREIPLRMYTRWGHHSTTEAARRLLAMALQDPLNERFVLLSESCVPIYPAATVYSQLLAEPLSRINACTKDDWYRDEGRWSWRMDTERLHFDHWRKHWQWFSLIRQHAQDVVDDNEVVRAFEEHCWDGWDDEKGEWRTCYSDEHYVSTLLAVLGKDEETDCMGFVTNADWSDYEGREANFHPRKYEKDEAAQPDLLFRLRLPEDGCDAEAAMAVSARQVIPAGQLSSAGFCPASSSANQTPAAPAAGGAAMQGDYPRVEVVRKLAESSMTSDEGDAAAHEDGRSAGQEPVQGRMAQNGARALAEAEGEHDTAGYEAAAGAEEAGSKEGGGDQEGGLPEGKLDYKCPVFARKFAPDTADVLLEALRDPAIGVLPYPD